MASSIIHYCKIGQWENKSIKLKTLRENHIGLNHFRGFFATIIETKEAL